MKCRHWETCKPREKAGLMGCMGRLCDDGISSVQSAALLAASDWLEQNNPLDDSEARRYGMVDIVYAVQLRLEGYKFAIDRLRRAATMKAEGLR